MVIILRNIGNDEQLPYLQQLAINLYRPETIKKKQTENMYIPVDCDT